MIKQFAIYSLIIRLLLSSNSLFADTEKTTAHMIMSAESEIAGITPNYSELDKILDEIKQKVSVILLENTKLNKRMALKILNAIHLILEEKGFRFRTTDLLSEAVNYCKDDHCYYSDCDTNSFIYYAVLYDLLGQKVSLISRWKHMYIRWYFYNDTYINWETTSGFEISEEDYFKLFKSNTIDELRTPTEVISSVYYTQGIINNIKKEYTKALGFLNKAVSMAPNASKYYNERGVVNYRLDRLEDSILDYTKAIDLVPEEVAYYSNRAISYHMLGNNEEAILDFSKAIELDSKEASYYGNRGISYYITGNYKQAIKDFSSALYIDPTNAAYYAGRGACYYSMSKYRKSIYDMSIAIRINPNDPDYYYVRAMAYQAINKTIEASLDKSRSQNLREVSPSLSVNPSTE